MDKTPKILGLLSIVFGSVVAAWTPLSLHILALAESVNAMARTLGRRAPYGSLSLAAIQAISDAERTWR